MLHVFLILVMAACRWVSSSACKLTHMRPDTAGAEAADTTEAMVAEVVVVVVAMGAVDMEVVAAAADTIDMGVAVVVAEVMGEVNCIENICQKLDLNASGPGCNSFTAMPVV